MGFYGAEPRMSTKADDAIHRLVTDAARLTRSWLEKLHAEGLSDGHYVELLGVVVSLVSIDEMHFALGIEPEALPDPQPGEPSRLRPEGLNLDVAWVPMLDPKRTADSESDLFPGGRSPNVIRAMSLVPEAVRLLKTLLAAQYVSLDRVGQPGSNAGRAISRPQIELVAGRVSALNDCFY